MIYTTIEWFALFLAVLSLVKISFILVKPNAWIKFASKLWRKPKTFGWISLILSFVVLYFLLQEMTIVQIFGAMLFFSLMMVMGFAPYMKELLPKAKQNVKKIVRDPSMRIYLLVWLALIIWVLWEIFTY